MKFLTTITTLALLAVPLALAGSTSQSGSQSGNGWSEWTTIPVTAGASFGLTSDTADFDIFFFDASGWYLGRSIECGNDAGVVPEGAVRAEISKWDDIGALAGGAASCLQPIFLAEGLSATWTYTES